MSGGIQQKSNVSLPGYDGVTYSADQFLSIDELVGFCAQKMNSTDEEIRSLVTGQNNSIANGKALADAETALNHCNATFSKNNKDLDGDSNAIDPDKTDAENYTAVCDCYNDLVKAASHATGAAKEAIQKKIDGLKSHFRACSYDESGAIKKDDSGTYTGALKTNDDGGPFAKGDFADGGKFSAKDLEPLKDTCQNEQSLNMIQIQSAMSKREQGVQLITNLIQKMTSMCESIINNLGK